MKFIGYELDETQLRQIINWQKFRSLDYLNRHPNAYRNQKGLTLYGKSKKKVWWLEMDEKEADKDTPLATIGSRLTTEFIERRIGALELRLSAMTEARATSVTNDPVLVRTLLLLQYGVI